MRRMTLGVGLVMALGLAAAGAMLGTAQSATTPKFGNCKPTGKFGSVPLKATLKRDTLTVGFIQLTPLTYKGNTPGSVNDGYNYCLAANIAWRGGLHKIALKKVDFAQLVIGKVGGYDMTIDDIYIKPEREQHVDFSIPYGHAWSGVVGLADHPLQQSELKNYKFAVTLGSVQQKYLDETLKPTQQENTYDDSNLLFQALRAKQVDAVLIDLPVALPAAAASNGALKVYAQVKVGGQVGIVMPQGTPNRAAANKMVRQMLANGTLKALERKYYFSAFGGIDPDSLPVWG
jgi:polar amino acid transport system substrate-binding protein